MGDAVRSGKKVKALREYTEHLTDKARRGDIDPLVGRHDEIARAAQVLSRRRKNNPIFVGEAGVGKTAIAEGLALGVVNKTVPEPLADLEILLLWIWGRYWQAPSIAEILRNALSR